MRFVSLNLDQTTLLLFSEGELRLTRKKITFRSLSLWTGHLNKYIKVKNVASRYSVLLFQPELIVDFTRFSPLTQIFLFFDQCFENHQTHLSGRMQSCLKLTRQYT